MAHVAVETETVKTVTLTLTEREADVIRALSGRCRFNGPAQSVFDAFEEAGIHGTQVHIPYSGVIDIEVRS